MKTSPNLVFFMALAAFPLFTKVSGQASSVKNQPCLTCGGVYTATSGGIVYKPFENLKMNERCAWVIRTPRATSYSLRLDKITPVAYNDVQLTVAAFGQNGTSPTHYKLSGTTTSVEVRSGTFLVITYATRVTSSFPSNSTFGFLLQYNATVSQAATLFSGQSVSVTVAESLGHLKHTSSPNMLSSYLFLPMNNYVAPSTGKYAFLKYIRLSLATTDFLSIYQYDPSYSEWRLYGRITYSRETYDANTYNSEMMLAVFQSGASTGSGFYWTYTFGGYYYPN